MSETLDQARVEALVAKLRTIAPFAGQQQADLEWFVAQSEERRVTVGEMTVKEDTPADMIFVIFEGELRARRASGAQAGPVFAARPGRGPVRVPRASMPA